MKKSIHYQKALNQTTKSDKHQTGFTLAEVLITLGIIGIVAAMTMPSLIQKYREKEYTTKLKKFYAVMENAGRLVEEEYGTIDSWGLSNSFVEDDSSTQEEIDKKTKSVNTFWARYGEFIGMSSRQKYGHVQYIKKIKNLF